jgi:SAM-dependent methyltransferase
MTDKSPSRYDVEIDLRRPSTHGRVLELVGQRQRVLDLGCATGALSRVLSERGCQVVGIDDDAEAAKLASEYCEQVIVGDVEELDLDVELGDRRFDVIVAADVLEHLRSPEATLTALRPFLAPGGYLVVSVPNVAHGSVRLALLNGSFPYSEVGLLDSTHLRFYTRASFVEMLVGGGFAPVHIDSIDLEIERSEVPFPTESPNAELIEHLRGQPDALAYQFVAVAYPTRPPLGAIPLLVGDLNRQLAESELERERLSEEGLRQQVAYMAELRGAREDAARLLEEQQRLRSQLSALEDESTALRQRLQATESSLREIHSSRLWKMATRYRKLVEVFRSDQ